MTNEIKHTPTPKTPGQIAYETELEYCPNYPSGKPRIQWNELPDYARARWEDDPTPREWAMKHGKAVQS